MPEPQALGKGQAGFTEPEHRLGGTAFPKNLQLQHKSQQFWKSGHGSTELEEAENSRAGHTERERSSAQGLAHHDELISSSFAVLGLVSLPQSNPFLSGSWGRQEVVFLLFHVAAALWNVNAGRHSIPWNFCEAPDEEDQELLLWK